MPTKKATAQATQKTTATADATDLVSTLRLRFDAHPERHRGITWERVQARLTSPVLAALAEMERTGGEPDVIGTDGEVVVFCDCAAESPKGRRSVCYDQAARLGRKEHAPATSALEMAEAMGITVLDETQYAALQALGAFDQKTSSWLTTPKDVRSEGGAIFGDRRFGRVFFYHNGAESYYGARGFRGLLRA